jgi:hypothetical protein
MRAVLRLVTHRLWARWRGWAMFVLLVALAKVIAVWGVPGEMGLRPCSDARLRQWPVMPPTLVLFMGAQSGLGKGSRLAG